MNGELRHALRAAVDKAKREQLGHVVCECGSCRRCYDRLRLPRRRKAYARRQP